MNGSPGPSRPHTGKIRAKFTVPATATAGRAPTLEFIGASGKTIAEAVRNAFANASRSLRTLDGVGVVVIPQLYQESPTPEFRVTLRISGAIPQGSLELPPPAPSR